MRKSLLILLLLILAGGCALCCAWLLRSAAGQAKLERWVQQRLPEEIRIRGLSGQLPLNGQLREVEVQDGSGVWLSARDLVWSVSLRSLLAGAPIAREISATSVRVHHWPEFEAGSGSSTLPRFWIQDIQVAEVLLPIELAGSALPLRIKGAFRVETNGWSAAASAVVSWQSEEAVAIGSARATGTNITFELRRVTAPGLEVAGRGTLQPERTMQLSGAFTNAPILSRFFGIEQLGEGAAQAVMRWDDELSADFTFAVSGAEDFGITLSSAAGTGTWREDDLAVRLTEASGVWREQEWRAIEPVEIKSDTSGIRWAASAVEWANLSFNSTGLLSEAEVAASVDVPALELAHTFISNRVTAGRARASVRVTGSRADPQWEFEIAGDDVRPRLDAAFQLHPAQFHASGALSSAVLRARATWEGWTKTPFVAEVALPVRLPLDGGPIGPNPTGAVSARLSFAVNLAEAGGYADLRGAELEGDIRGNIALGGTWAQPEIHGDVALLDGRAEYPESGTVLNNIRLVVAGDQDRLVIREASADDGEGGRLSLNGAFHFESGKGFPLEAKLEMNRVALWRKPNQQARFNGTVSVLGPLSALLVTGKVELVDTEIRLRPPPPSIPTLPLAREREEAAAVASTSTWLHTVSLDLGVRGREIHVSGRGLESTWRTDLKVSGRASAPKIRGEVSIDRGYFLFMGRRFLLDRAAVLFDGQWPPAPLLDIVASSRVGEMHAWLYANGPISAPVLNLESDPAYPPDEILSRLLFSRSTDSISPLQAVRLAHGLNVLRGRGSTIDVLERGQSALRIDQLELVQSDASEGISAISVGKYVGSNVYVSGEKGLGGAADLITVEVDLTPSLVLTTESSPRIREGIGLKWRRDY